LLFIEEQSDNTYVNFIKPNKEKLLLTLILFFWLSLPLLIYNIYLTSGNHTDHICQIPITPSETPSPNQAPIPRRPQESLQNYWFGLHYDASSCYAPYKRFDLLMQGVTSSPVAIFIFCYVISCLIVYFKNKHQPNTNPSLKYIANLFIAFIVFLALLIGGFLYWHSRGSPPPFFKPTITPLPTNIDSFNSCNVDSDCALYNKADASPESLYCGQPCADLTSNSFIAVNNGWLQNKKAQTGMVACPMNMPYCPDVIKTNQQVHVVCQQNICTKIVK